MDRMCATRRSGFSVIELMLAVAILGVLAALAMTQFRKYQDDARRSEVDTNLDGIHTSLTAFHLDREGEGLIGGFNPSRTSLSRQARPWNSGVDASVVKAWDTLGWAPDGEVRCSYFFEDYGYTGEFYARGVCDIDQDGIEFDAWIWSAGLLAGGGKLTKMNPKEF